MNDDLLKEFSPKQVEELEKIIESIRVSRGP